MLFFLPFLSVLLFISPPPLSSSSPLLFPLFPFSLAFLFQQILFSFHAYSGFEYHGNKKEVVPTSETLSREVMEWVGPALVHHSDTAGPGGIVGRWVVHSPPYSLSRLSARVQELLKAD